LQEAGVGIGTAVMGHLEHVGAQVGAGGDDVGLGGGTEVAGEENADPPVTEADDHREVVRCGEGGRLLRRWREDLEPRLAFRPPVPGNQDGPLSAGALHERIQGWPPVVCG
jgi:hypothetical protein